MIPCPARSLRGATALLLTLALGTVGVAPPAAAQDWRLPGLEGGALSRADVAQGATILVVWASWSPRCRDIVSRVNELAGRWGGQARVVTVNFQEERSTVSGFLAGQGLRVPVFLDSDGNFSKDHRVSTLPGLVIYRDGAVAYQGKLPDDADEAISAALR
jgi:thiol-disulfide isomerase/thioredoxin